MHVLVTPILHISAGVTEQADMVHNISHQITVIIPTYNEHNNLQPLLRRVHAALSRVNYEMLLIDDNSSDGTAELAQSLASQYPVRVIIRKDEKGLASAVVHGLRHAKGDIAAVIDADLQHPPELLPVLLEAIQGGAQVAVASRYVKGGGCQGWSVLRRLVSKTATMLAHVFLPSTRKILDPMSGYFMLDKDVVSGADLNPMGYKILLEILVKGKFTRVAEVPYCFAVRSSGESKLGLRQQADYLRHLYLLMRSSGEFSRFIKYCLVGASGVIVDEGVFWLLIHFAGLFNILAAALSAEFAIITNFTLNNYFTFADRRLSGVGAFLVRLAKFNLVSLIGIGLKLAVLWLLTYIFGSFDLLFNLCGIAVATLWNYLMNTWWTWK
jgi:dolichol-phosphate mannosyltransferase